MTSGPRTGVVAVTGASGFIGRELCKFLEFRGMAVKRVVRNGECTDSVVPVGDVGPNTEWKAALSGVDCVIHTVARAHVLDETSDAMTEFRRVNAEGTRRLAEEAARFGVRRLLFLSSIGVLGVRTDNGVPFDIHSRPSPVDNYARSKYEAEEALREVARDTKLEIVIIRPPLVYGPNAPGNFARLVRLVERGVPLPFGSVKNSRSLVGLDNLISLLVLCMEHPAAAGKIFLVSDGNDISTPDLIRGIARHAKRTVILLPVPPPLLRLGARIMARLPELEKLIGSLQVDIEYTCETLGWMPPVTVEEGLRRATSRKP